MSHILGLFFTNDFTKVVTHVIRSLKRYFCQDKNRAKMKLKRSGNEVGGAVVKCASFGGRCWMQS